ncbi:MAG TPA: hypothetical protein VFC94_06335 [Bacteroidaceae bacterium]|nr:hypothetical protein [Bacteroidaceae bacterium]
MIIKRVVKLIRIEIVVMFLIAGIVILFFETGLLLGGTVTDASVIYIAEVLAVLMALGLIPITLKGCKIVLKRLKKEDIESRIVCYRNCAQLRVFAYAIFILYSLFLYYLTDRDTGLYCAIIGAVFTAFIFPTKVGVENYIEQEEE